jgi:crotonobetainyl-CoA:carnitine CoA-transferase CaiB-like acyl-CoA transferase
MALQGVAALSGITVVEIAGGAAGAYCGRLLADAGASVTVLKIKGVTELGECRAKLKTERLYAEYLEAGKQQSVVDLAQLPDVCRNADIIVIGEDALVFAQQLEPRICSVELTWFGKTGPYANWKGNDLIVQSLTAMPHLVGPREGPPAYGGDRHATLVAGVTAYIAALSGIVAGRTANACRRFELNILEANLVLSEMDIHFVERDRLPLKRHGINRFSPNGPVGIYRCKDGWVGITATTPDQWLSLCAALEMHELAADPSLGTRELRFQRLDEVEAAMTRALAARTAEQWAELGRKHRVPIVPVPKARGILNHPIFKARNSLAEFVSDRKRYQVPRTPFGLTATPTATNLDTSPKHGESNYPAGKAAAQEAPLAGLTIVDFAMGWAGPLATRLLADLGANVLKIEAGRYPDWWRGVNWTAEYIANKQYEDAKGFCALNRGKQGVSLDLTTDAGRNMALSLIAKADAVVENQAAGVMQKLGLSYEAMQAVNPSIVLLSMSAFGTGNPWSATRAYGSTLEQGSGLPSFVGFPDWPPTMAHLAYGDPVGGLFGCAAALTALAHRKRCGQGQYVNLSMIECMLQFTAPALLEHQATGAEPVRRGNRHAALAPHNIYRCAGDDNWIAIAISGVDDFNRLARVIGCADWAARGDFATLQDRKNSEDEIDEAIEHWTRSRSPEEASRLLQDAGVAAAPVLHTEQLVDDAHLSQAKFFIDLERKISGPQRQAGIAITQMGARLGARSPAPLLGEHSWTVLHSHLGLTRTQFDQLVCDGVVCFEPKSLRSTAPGTGAPAVPAMAAS